MFSKKTKDTKKKKRSAVVTIGTFIEKNTTITGDILSTSSIKIDGKVSGNISTVADCFIGESGLIAGDIRAKDVVNSGCVRGNIDANETITLSSTGRIDGDIKTTGFIVDIGSHFSGKCTIIDGDKAVNVGESLPENIALTEGAPKKEEAKVKKPGRMKMLAARTKKVMRKDKPVDNSPSAPEPKFEAVVSTTSDTGEMVEIGN
ncbi:MAG: polymer-forming cytoskeletal protein [Clostridiales bacterium]|jgi:cytoskeletal protein CcmA (bactofilin family)|nr:polymer-forming cytoskeletal protein [Clostridiales bacterium]